MKEYRDNNKCNDYYNKTMMTLITITNKMIMTMTKIIMWWIDNEVASTIKIKCVINNHLNNNNANTPNLNHS